MANTKSAIKRIRRISKQTAVNKARKSRYKNALKKMNLLIEGKKKSDALKFLLFCLQNPHEILRFILHQVMLPHSGSLSLERRLEKLPHYGKSWITAFQNRLDNDSN